MRAEGASPKAATPAGRERTPAPTMFFTRLKTSFGIVAPSAAGTAPPGGMSEGTVVEARDVVVVVVEATTRVEEEGEEAYPPLMDRSDAVDPRGWCLPKKSLEEGEDA